MIQPQSTTAYDLPRSSSLPLDPKGRRGGEGSKRRKSKDNEITCVGGQGKERSSSGCHAPDAICSWVKVWAREGKRCHKGVGVE